MSAGIQMRCYAAGSDLVGGSVVPTIVLDRDLVALTSSIRAGEGETFQQAFQEVTIAASSAVSVSLRDAANPWVDPIGRPLQLAGLSFLYLALVAPASGQKLRYGPQGVSGAAQLWFGATGATAYDVTTDADLRLFRTGGVTVSGGSGLLPLTNPSSVDAITVRLWVAGIKV